jgi:hypothetical protein
LQQYIVLDSQYETPRTSVQLNYVQVAAGSSDSSDAEADLAEDETFSCPMTPLSQTPVGDLGVMYRVPKTARQLSVDSGVLSMSHQQQTQSTRLDQVLSLQPSVSAPLSQTITAECDGSSADDTTAWPNYTWATPGGVGTHTANHARSKHTSQTSHHSIVSDVSSCSASDAVFEESGCADIHGNCRNTTIVQQSTCF